MPTLPFGAHLHPEAQVQDLVQAPAPGAAGEVVVVVVVVATPKAVAVAEEDQVEAVVVVEGTGTHVEAEEGSCLSQTSTEVGVSFFVPSPQGSGSEERTLMRWV